MLEWQGLELIQVNPFLSSISCVGVNLVGTSPALCFDLNFVGRISALMIKLPWENLKLVPQLTKASANLALIFVPALSKQLTTYY